MNISTALLLYGPRRKKSDSSLVLYAPLSSAAAAAVTGQTITPTGTPEYATVSGVPCLHVDGHTLTIASTNLPMGNSVRTVSMLMRRTGTYTGTEATLVSWGTPSCSCSFDFGVSGGNICLDTYQGQITGNSISMTEWHHVAVAYNGSVFTFYIDGTAAGTGSTLVATADSGSMRIGTSMSGDWPFGEGRISELKVWNRALSAGEIAAESARCLAMIDTTLPVFYAPLASSRTADEMGTTWTENDVVYTTMHGIPCLHIEGDGHNISCSSGLPALAGTAKKSIAIWACIEKGRSGYYPRLFNLYSGNAERQEFGFQLDQEVSISASWYSGDVFMNPLDFDVWHHYCYTYDGTTSVGYLDGVQIFSIARDLSPNSCTSLGFNTMPGGSLWAYLASARIYSRVLSASEVQALASEFNPVYEDCVFYAPLSAASSTAATGQTLTASGTLTYQTVSGVPCVYFDGSSALEVSPVSAITLGRGDKTISLFFRTAADASAYEAIAYIGDTGRTASGCFGLFAYPGGGIDLSIVDTECQTTGAAYTSWTHVAGVYSGSALKLYVNGTLSQTLSGTLSLVTDRFTLGKQTADGDPYTGYLAEVKVWNRALSDAEIAAESSRCLGLATPITLISHLYPDGSSYTSTIMSSSSYVSPQSGMTVSSFHDMYVSGGGTVSSSVVMDAGHLYILRGGRADDTTMSGGIMYVSNGGYAHTAVMSGGSANVSSGGSADGITVSSGGGFYVYSGGSANTVTVFSGGICGVSGTVSGLIISGDPSVTTVTASASIVDGGTASGISLNNALLNIQSGTASTLTLNASLLNISRGGTVSGAVAASSWIKVSSGGFMENTSLCYASDGSTRMDVSSGASANMITVDSRAWLVVFSGGTATNVTSSAGAFIYASSGGTITYTT